MARRVRLDLARSGRPTREPKVRFYIYCEDRNASPEYFKAFRRSFPNSLIEVITQPGAGVPTTITQKAVEHIRRLKRAGRARNSFEENDQVWAVFDRDEHERVLESINLCDTHQIGVGYSNPCFEVWLILHEEDFHKSDDRHAVQRHYAHIKPDYDHSGSKCPNCDEVVTRVLIAESRAQKGLEERDRLGNQYDAPCTTVYKLTRAIRGAANKSARK